jgi:hypothetical protein
MERNGERGASKWTEDKIMREDEKEKKMKQYERKRDGTFCSPVEVHRRFRGTYCDQQEGRASCTLLCSETSVNFWQKVVLSIIMAVRTSNPSKKRDVKREKEKINQSKERKKERNKSGKARKEKRGR